MWNLCIFGFPILVASILVYGAFFKKYTPPENNLSDNDFNASDLYAGVEDELLN